MPHPRLSLELAQARPGGAGCSGTGSGRPSCFPCFLAYPNCYLTSLLWNTICHLFVFISERAWTSSGVYARCSSCLSPNNISSLTYFEDYQNAMRTAFQKSFVHYITFTRVEIISSIESK